MKNQSFCFQRELRLLNASDYSRVFDKAFKVHNPAFTLLARKNTFKHPRLGLVIAKKNLRFAYQRNYVKRVLREGFRVLQHDLEPYDLVILTRRDIAVLPKTDIIRFRNELFDKFRAKCKRY